MPEQQFQFNCTGSVTLDIINNVPGLNIAQDFTTGLLGANSNFDPGAGTLDITFGSVQGPASYGTITYLVDDNGVQSSFEIYIIDCCIKFYRPDLIVINASTSSLGSPQLINQSILVLNELFIDDPIEFITCDIKMGAEARLLLQAGTSLTIARCTIANFCAYRWDGVLASNEATIIQIEESEIKGAGRGFLLEDDVTLISTATTFRDNVRSITASNYQQLGSFHNNSRWQLRGNTFVSSPTPLGFHNLSQVPPLILNANKFIYIYLQNCLSMQIGEANQAKNTFKQIEGHSIRADYTNDLGIENNDFLLASNPIKLYFSKADIGGPSLAQSNRFIANTGIFSESSYQEIRYNTFLYSGVTILNPNNYLNGTLESVLMHRNHAEFSEFSISYTSVLHTADVIINNNRIVNSTLNLTNIGTASNMNGVRVFENEFGWCALESGTYNVKLNNTPGIRFGDNEFKIMNAMGPATCPPSPPGIRGRGLLAFDVPNAQFKANDFNECTLGFYGEGDFANTQFSCNTFRDNDTGMYFYDALLSDQGTEADPNIPGSINQVNANTWSGNNHKNLVIEVSSSFNSFASKYVCEGPNNGFPYFYNPEYLTSTNLNGFSRIGPGNYSWQITPVNNYNSNGSFLSVPNVPDCGILNKIEREQNPINADFIIYPNPAIDYFEYQINEGLKPDAHLMLYDLLGQVLLQTKIKEQHGIVALNLPSGTYYIVLTNGNHINKSAITVIKK